MKIQNSGNNIDVPAQKINSRKSQVFGPNHHRNQKVTEHGRNRRDQKKENHDLAVHGEGLVVHIGRHQVTCGREQFQSDEQGEEAADEKEKRDREQVEQRNALVVSGEQPRANAILCIDVILPFCTYYCGSPFFPFTALAAAVLFLRVRRKSLLLLPEPDSKILC